MVVAFPIISKEKITTECTNEQWLEKTDVLFGKWWYFYSNDKQDDLDDKIFDIVCCLYILFLAQNFTSQMQNLCTLMKIA